MRAALIRAAIVAALLLPCLARANYVQVAAGTIANGATYTGPGWTTKGAPTVVAVAQFTTTAMAGTFTINIDGSVDGVNWKQQISTTNSGAIGSAGTYQMSIPLTSVSGSNTYAICPYPFVRIRATNGLTTQTATSVLLGIIAN